MNHHDDKLILLEINGPFFVNVFCWIKYLMPVSALLEGTMLDN